MSRIEEYELAAENYVQLCRKVRELERSSTSEEMPRKELSQLRAEEEAAHQEYMSKWQAYWISDEPKSLQ